MYEDDLSTADKHKLTVTGLESCMGKLGILSTEISSNIYLRLS